MAEDLLIIGTRNGVGEEFASFACQTGTSATFMGVENLVPSTNREGCHLIIFLEKAWSHNARVIDALVAFAASFKTVCVVSSSSTHFSDHALLAFEVKLCQLLHEAKCRTVVLRPSFLLSQTSPWQRWLNRIWFLHFLIPPSISSCFVDLAELSHAMLAEVSRERAPRSRVLTLLGPNRTWRNIFAKEVRPSYFQKILGVIPWLISWLGIGYALVLVFLLISRVRPSLRRYHFRSLEPTSRAELLALYNIYNYRHIQIAGYNNGVVHFGWKFPGKTVVLTRSAGDRATLRGNAITVDAGVTLKRAVQVASGGGKEFLVLPNYSYVSTGTAFFVPIHGSGSEVSTLGESIEKVLLYDPVDDRLIVRKRTDQEFTQWMYHREKPLLLLRLTFRVRDKTAYYSQKATHESPSGEFVWSAFSDTEACNIEIRKAGSRAAAIDIYKYYHRPPAGIGELLEVPRDSLGRLWDRLEENPISSWLFHWLTRKLGYHVELFLDREEFLAFWVDHVNLPLAKMQLRLVHQDGLTHSPCAEVDRISIDLFFSRNRQGDFLKYMNQYLPHARFNPGKHSM